MNLEEEGKEVPPDDYVPDKYKPEPPITKEGLKFLREQRNRPADDTDWGGPW